MSNYSDEFDPFAHNDFAERRAWIVTNGGQVFVGPPGVVHDDLLADANIDSDDVAAEGEIQGSGHVVQIKPLGDEFATQVEEAVEDDTAVKLGSSKKPTPFNVTPEGLVTFLKPGEQGMGNIIPVGKLYRIEGVDSALHHHVHRAWTQTLDPPNLKQQKGGTAPTDTALGVRARHAATGHGSSDWGQFESQPTTTVDVPGSAPGLKPELQGADVPSQSFRDGLCRDCNRPLNGESTCPHCLSPQQLVAEQNWRVGTLAEADAHVPDFSERNVVVLKLDPQGLQELGRDWGLDSEAHVQMPMFDAGLANHQDDWGDRVVMDQRKVHAGEPSNSLARLQLNWLPANDGMESVTAKLDGNPIGVLTIVPSHNNDPGMPFLDPASNADWTIFNVQVIPGYQRMGVASAMLAFARQKYSIGHSTNLSESGEQWANKVGATPPVISANTQKMGLDSNTSQYWVYLDGQVAFDTYPWRAARTLAMRTHPDKVDYIANTIARNDIPNGIECAVGELSQNRPQIWLSNVDRNAVWDAVLRAHSTGQTSMDSSGAGEGQGYPQSHSPLAQELDHPRTTSSGLAESVHQPGYTYSTLNHTVHYPHARTGAEGYIAPNSATAYPLATQKFIETIEEGGGERVVDSASFRAEQVLRETYGLGQQWAYMHARSIMRMYEAEGIDALKQIVQTPPAPSEEFANEMWPDTLPWGDEEQNYYRTSAYVTEAEAREFGKNYIDALATKILDECKESEIPDDSKARIMDLFRLYAMLALTKGKDTTAEDVHDAWATWRVQDDPDHKSLVPFDELTDEVKSYDEPYVTYIHKHAHVTRNKFRGATAPSMAGSAHDTRRIPSGARDAADHREADAHLLDTGSHSVARGAQRFATGWSGDGSDEALRAHESELPRTLPEAAAVQALSMQHWSMPYHVSPRGNRDGIQYEGLQDQLGNGLHFWDTAEQAAAYWKWLMPELQFGPTQTDVWHADLTPEELAQRQPDTTLEGDMAHFNEHGTPNMFYNEQGEFGAYRLPKEIKSVPPERMRRVDAHIKQHAYAAVLNMYTTGYRVARHEARHGGGLGNHIGGFYITAADVEQLAAEALQRLESRDDIAAILNAADKNNSGGHDSPTRILTKQQQEVYAFMQALYQPGLSGIPPETYKMWEWFVGQLKRGEITWRYDGAHATDILKQATKWMQWSQQQHAPIPDWKRKNFTFENMQDWVYKMQEDHGGGQSQWTQEKKIFNWPDGWYMAEVGPEDCTLEGKLMGHCVGGYSNQVESGRSYIVSLRDPKGQPHVTLEMEGQKPHEYEGASYDPSDLTWSVHQIQGKQDTKPIEEYRERVKQWFESLKEEGLNIRWSDDAQGNNDAEPEYLEDRATHTQVNKLPHVLDALDAINENGMGSYHEDDYDVPENNYTQSETDPDYGIEGNQNKTYVIPANTIEMPYSERSADNDLGHLIKLWKEFIQSILDGKITDVEEIQRYCQGFYFIPKTDEQHGRWYNHPLVERTYPRDGGAGKMKVWIDAAHEVMSEHDPQPARAPHKPVQNEQLFDTQQMVTAPQRQQQQAGALIDYALKYMAALYTGYENIRPGERNTPGYGNDRPAEQQRIQERYYPLPGNPPAYQRQFVRQYLPGGQEIAPAVTPPSARQESYDNPWDVDHRPPNVQPKVVTKVAGMYIKRWVWVNGQVHLNDGEDASHANLGYDHVPGYGDPTNPARNYAAGYVSFEDNMPYVEWNGTRASDERVLSDVQRAMMDKSQGQLFSSYLPDTLRLGSAFATSGSHVEAWGGKKINPVGPGGFYCTRCGEGPWATVALLQQHIENVHGEKFSFAPAVPLPPAPPAMVQPGVAQQAQPPAGVRMPQMVQRSRPSRLYRNITIVGGTPAQQMQVDAALKQGKLNWAILPAIRVMIRNLGTGAASDATPGVVNIDSNLLNSGQFAWGTIIHEMCHQIDFYLLTDDMRTQLMPLLGVQSWQGAHPMAGIERFASSLAYALWPSRSNSMAPTGDGETQTNPQFMQTVMQLLPTLRTGSTKLADYNGWSNWDTWHTALMMDNDEPLYRESRRLMENGMTVEQLRDWCIANVLGPHNKQSIEDAQEWNDIPEHDRLDPHYEDLKERSPGAADIVDALGMGADTSDETPRLMEDSLINWQEIWDHLYDEIRENIEYEQMGDKAKQHGIEWYQPGTDPTEPHNLMQDAWMKHHGIMSQEQRLENGAHAGYHTILQLTNDQLPSDKKIDADAEHSYWGHDPESYEHPDKRPMSVSDYGWDTVGDIQRGRANPYQVQTMQQALTAQGHTPEQIAALMKQRWHWDGENWIDLDPTPQQTDQTLDQPGEMTMPEHWGSKTSSTLPFYSDCVGWPNYNSHCALDYCIEHGREISRAQFQRMTGARASELPPGNLYGTTYYSVPGFPCYFYVNSAVEYVYATEQTIAQLDALALKEWEDWENSPHTSAVQLRGPEVQYAAALMRGKLNNGGSTHNVMQEVSAALGRFFPHLTGQDIQQVMQLGASFAGLKREPSIEDETGLTWDYTHDWHAPDDPMTNALRDRSIEKGKERSNIMGDPRFVEQWSPPGIGATPLNFPNQPYLSATARVLYHAAPVEARESIIQHGIDYRVPHGEHEPPEDTEDVTWATPGNYLAETPQDAASHTPNADIWEVNCDGLHLQPDEAWHRGWFTTEPIGVERIRLHSQRTSGTWDSTVCSHCGQLLGVNAHCPMCNKVNQMHKEPSIEDLGDRLTIPQSDQYPFPEMGNDPRWSKAVSGAVSAGTPPTSKVGPVLSALPDRHHTGVKTAELAQRYYHGTNIELGPGETLTPRPQDRPPNYPNVEYSNKVVYFSTQEHLAERYAVGIAGRFGGQPHVYEVVAQDVQPDPEQQTGWSTDQFIASSAQIVREIDLPGYTHWNPEMQSIMRGPAPVTPNSDIQGVWNQPQDTTAPGGAAPVPPSGPTRSARTSESHAAPSVEGGSKSKERETTSAVDPQLDGDQWQREWNAATKTSMDEYKMCECNCGCECDGDWHFNEPRCICKSMGCDCVQDEPDRPITKAALSAQDAPSAPRSPGEAVQAASATYGAATEWNTKPENWSPMKIDQAQSTPEFHMPLQVEQRFVNAQECPECKSVLADRDGSGVQCTYCGWRPRTQAPDQS